MSFLDESMCIVYVPIHKELRGIFQSPRTEVTGDYEFPFGSWESFSGSLSRSKGSSLVRFPPIPKGHCFKYTNNMSPERVNIAKSEIQTSDTKVTHFH